MKLRTIVEVIIVFSMIGTLVAAYSTYEHYELLSGAAGDQFCDLSAELSCSAVNSSPYSEFMGIPTAGMGVLWFFVVIVLAHMTGLQRKKGFWKNSAFYLFAWAVMGMLFVIYLIYAELFLIGSICLLCTVVHIITVLVLVLSYKAMDKPIKEYLTDIFYK